MTTQAYRQLVGTDTFADSFGYLNDSDAALRALFEGTTEPPSSVRVPYMLWADTANNLLKGRNSANDAWITLGTLGVATLGLLSRAGGTMTGAINMGGFGITNLPLGTGTAAARQQEVDLKAPLASPAFTTDATLNADPPTANSLVRKSWAQSQFLGLAGGTMTGALTLNANATASLHPVALQQLAAFVAFSTTSGHRHTGSDSRKVQGQDLDSTGHPVGALLRANGTTYDHQSPALTQFVFRDTPELVVDITTSPGTYQDVNISAHTTSDAYVALLRVVLVGGTGVFRFRPNGSANDNANMDRTIPPATFAEFWVPLEQSTRIFEWKYSSGSATSTKFYLVAYKRSLL